MPERMRPIRRSNNSSQTDAPPHLIPDPFDEELGDDTDTVINSYINDNQTPEYLTRVTSDILPSLTVPFNQNEMMGYTSELLMDQSVGQCIIDELNEIFAMINSDDNLDFKMKKLLQHIRWFKNQGMT